MSSEGQFDDIPVVRDHRRQWRECRYVYPVISRRAGGMSIGVNLNLEKGCNFSCVYCQIDRHVSRGLRGVEVAKLTGELREAMTAATSGEIWREPRFASTPAALQRVNDIAFSGDGEPTCVANFPAAVAAAANVREECDADSVKIVVITNATRLDSDEVRRALPILDDNNGEIWAKLDAGTEERFRRINRPHPQMTLQRIVDNILSVALGREVVIQTLLFRLDGELPPAEEIDAYCGRLRGIIGNGGQVRLVQLHTVARPPAEACVASLSDTELNAIAEQVRASLPGVSVETYGGADVAPQRSEQG
jgi:wyosine [tRNA(Phe)-imidazoG37] synthetase (radical SAM superfamily)